MDTKKLRQKILDLAIRGKLVPQDPNDEPASVLLERIKAEKERLIKEGKIKRSKKTAKTSDTPHYENVPFNVPDNWIWTTVEEILELVSGQDFPPEKYNNNVSGVPYIIGASNIENEQLVINRWTEFPSVFSYINDLLVVCKGAGVGKMAINNIGTAHIARQIQAVRAYTNYINIKYIKAVVKHNIEDIISKANGLIPGLKRELLLSLQIPLPPFSEQQRIIIEMEHLFTLIDKVEENKYDLQAIIKQAKNKILDLAIQGKLVQQDLNEEPASELLKRINPKAEITCDNGHYTQLPEGWQIVSMQTLCNLIDGEKQSGIERINLDVKYLRGERDAKKLMAGKYIPANSLLILVDGENSGEVFRTPIDGYQGSTFKQLSITDEMNADYVLQVISLHRKTLRENKVGSAIPHLNKKLFKAIEVPIPPYNQQKKIVEAINIMFKHLDAIMESL
ncbi:restriction endonuclease subunit S [Phocaeicola plebeius]|uniref:restriction endonuclease subunit S n=1 Tax=Phocaeicola plebeius TaxID=310297 RepID=UPI003566235F